MPDWGLSREAEPATSAPQHDLRARVLAEVRATLHEHQQQAAALEAAERRWNDPAALRERLRELTETRVAALGLFLLLQVLPAPLEHRLWLDVVSAVLPGR